MRPRHARDHPRAAGQSGRGPPRRRRRPALPRRATRGLGSLRSACPAHVGARTSARPRRAVSVLLAYLLLVIGVAAVGGAGPGSSLQSQAPARELVLHAAATHVHDQREQNVVALFAFLTVDVARERVRRLAARRTARATRSARKPRPLLGPRARSRSMHCWRGCSGAGASTTCGVSTAPAPAAKLEAAAGDHRRCPRRDRRPPSRSTRSTTIVVERAQAPTVEDRAILQAYAHRSPQRSSAKRSQAAAAAIASQPRTSAGRPAPGRVPRPAHSARRDQGIGDEPLLSRC